MFRRSILDRFDEWIRSEHRKPMMVRGARQVGKTTAIRMFGESLPGFMELNMEAPGEGTIFRQGFPVEDVVRAIRLTKGITVPMKESLLFVDEIQASPPAVAAIRFLKERVPELPVIVSGSLLEMTSSDAGTSFPVGRVEHRFMHPVTFREYLGAMGMQHLLDALDEVPLPDYAHTALYEEYLRYVITGGMPEIVQRLTAGAGIEYLGTVFGSLQQSFLDDVPKYSRNSSMAEILRVCLESAPSEVGHRITFQGFGGSRYRSREVGEAMRTLERAMLLQLVYPTPDTEPPPTPNRRRAPKLLALDSGLLSHALGAQSELLGSGDLNASFRGTFAEQCVGQALLALQVETKPSLLFWARDSRGSTAEVDYIVRHRGMLFPVEVKSGASGRMRSLHEFMRRSPGDLAIRVYGGPVRLEPVHGPGGDPRYRLLSLPHSLSGEVHKYLDWCLEDQTCQGSAPL